MNKYFLVAFKTSVVGVLLVAVLSQISACGQRGALYLPAEKDVETEVKANGTADPTDSRNAGNASGDKTDADSKSTPTPA